MTRPAGVRGAGDLAGLAPPWTSTARIVREGERIVGAVVVEWDEEVGRAWVMGPWVAHDDDRWSEVAGSLLDVAPEQVPAAIGRHELSGDLANRRLAALAGPGLVGRPRRTTCCPSTPGSPPVGSPRTSPACAPRPPRTWKASGRCTTPSSRERLGFRTERSIAGYRSWEQ